MEELEGIEQVTKCTRGRRWWKREEITNTVDIIQNWIYCTAVAQKPDIYRCIRSSRDTLGFFGDSGYLSIV